MTKAKKTLKEEFEFWYQHAEEISMENIYGFFEPHLKKQSQKKPDIEIPDFEIKVFNEFWPQLKLPTGQYGRCNLNELKSSFKSFFKQFPTYTDWAIIHQAAKNYLDEKERDNWEFTRRSKYFVRREMKDKSVDYLLAEYYERARDGVQESFIPSNENKGFEPRIIE